MCEKRERECEGRGWRQWGLENNNGFMFLFACWSCSVGSGTIFMRRNVQCFCCLFCWLTSAVSIIVFRGQQGHRVNLKLIWRKTHSLSVSEGLLRCDLKCFLKCVKKPRSVMVTHMHYADKTVDYTADHLFLWIKVNYYNDGIAYITNATCQINSYSKKFGTSDWGMMKPIHN